MGKKKKQVLGEFKKLDENCKHVFKFVGFWDGEENGEPAGGPLTECVKCHGKKTFTPGEWQKLSKKQKAK